VEKGSVGRAATRSAFHQMPVRQQFPLGPSVLAPARRMNALALDRVSSPIASPGTFRAALPTGTGRQLRNDRPVAQGKPKWDNLRNELLH
jgi:hypothetical protein